MRRAREALSQGRPGARARKSGSSRFTTACKAACLVVILSLAAACRRTPPPAPPLFELLSPRATGITFANALPEAADFNILNYLYYYNGGGVAVGDVDGDGRTDVYLTSNLGANRLYLNRGDFRFEDVTERAGVGDSVGWKTGVTMADVNGDGRLDLYVSGVSYLGMHGRNVLYVNDGPGPGQVPTFTDRTRELGLDYAGYATQATFFDYDRDGDLDMYLLTHATHTERAVGAGEPGAPGGGTAARKGGDRLYRNDVGPNGVGRRFVDVSEAAGIHDGAATFGLGVVASDLDSDGCVDLYVANDFQENDRLYHNACDGTFTERLTEATGHTSRFSMGVDAADFDNDLRPDLFVADMLPEREDVLKTSAGAESFTLFNLRLRAGYQPQYPRNTLQLNRGALRFSEVGYQAGVFASDWSWAPLFADLDNDGRKDLFVTNGIYRRPNDLDYINFVGHEAVQAALAKGVTERELALLQRMPQIALPNHAFRNEGGPGSSPGQALRFVDAAEAWGLAQPGFSNGAAYADLNDDGALDLVVNRINAPAAIYRGRARERNGNAYLTIALRGAGANSAGIGTKVYVTAGGATQLAEQMPTRGFQSSVEPRLHFGLGRAARADSLVVVWPDGRFQVMRDVPANRTLTLAQRDAAGRYAYAAAPAPLLADATAEVGIAARHVESPFLDTDHEPLLPHLLSTEGPALATGDVNGDGLDDVFLGGAKWQPAQLLVQRRDGTFRPVAVPAIAADSVAEDVDAAFFDANGDGRLDLYVVSGGNEFWGDAEPLRDRLYLNEGDGRFRRAADALPVFHHTGSCVAPGDYDGDGDVDLFVGSRVVARAYGLAPRSYLLRNDGESGPGRAARFVDVTDEVAPGLASLGMVTGAAWTDTDGDGRRDLVVVGEWMPVTVLRNESGSRLVDRTREAGLAGTEGWWNSVTLADLDRDGRDDLVLGNLGLNAYVRASPAEPARLYVHDFGSNGTLEQVLTVYKRGVSYPVAGRDDLTKLVSPLRARFPSYASFGASRVEQIFDAGELRKARVLEARTFASSVALSDGRGGYTLHALPAAAQLSTVFAALADDFDGDGTTDLLLGGNLHGVPPTLGRQDASYGTLLLGTGGGRFAAADLARAGVAIEGQVRGLAHVRHAGGGALVVVARNDDRLLALRPTGGRAAPRRVAAMARR